MSSQGSRQTLLRQWELLKFLPTRPPGMTARDICQQLNDEGFDVSKRQVERDLDQLSQSFALECNDKGKPYGWHWMEGAGADMPAISAAEALSLTMVEKVLSPLVPNTVLKSIAPRLNQAKDKLAKLHQGASLGSWKSKVAYVPATLQQLSPSINDSVLNNVQLALLHNQCVDVVYQPGSQPDATKTYTLHPLAIVQRGVSTYLVACVDPYDDPLLFALHRMHDATPRDDKQTKIPEGFTLKGYLEKGALQFSDGNTFTLKARINDNLAMHLTETPLSDDQQITADGETNILTATVIDSWQLHWWVKSMGAQIEVLAPESFRDSIVEELKETLAAYNR
ncbi:helix-turn-helix transcriptional regulator [Idiomarina sp. UBA4520]|uniref:helix-turn-helix transcriptional regulator n=1 Tax=Idiomarina sp. UBA4520 TaxID=1946647 RepID=UPI000C6276D0|nr:MULTISPECIES: WYL domain-containing protein [unclassified Idiomarina]MBF38669.1 WYL domain-containing protein [Idiomarinaceae bacterium]|tara:strand:- start:30125 stop:31138 length:1014 start_codon:yes stop_codon:yes gene_type:complete